MIKVNLNQQGNKLLTFLNRSTWYHDNSCTYDYEINHLGILFLSLNFHCCKPEYILKRMANKTANQILLILLDTFNYQPCLLEIYPFAYKNNFKILLANNYDQCGYLINLIDQNFYKTTEYLKIKLENKIDNFLEKFPKINKTDIKEIKKSVFSLKEFVNMNEVSVSRIQGIGKSKADLIMKYINKPFKE